MFPLTIAAAVLALMPAHAGSQPLRETARQISAAARNRGVIKIAVPPLEERGSSRSRDGELLAEKLVEQLVRLGRIKVVERGNLPALMSERRLLETGALGIDAGAPAEARALLQAADAVVTGSFDRRGEKVRVSCRLVHAGTGEILAAVEERIMWEGSDPEADGSWTLVVPAPQFMTGVPSFKDDLFELRDAPNEEDCSEAGDLVDRIEGDILELKTRYWAGQLRQGVSPYGLTRNPGSTISDPNLKRRFYDTLRNWYYRADLPELTPREMERFQREDARALEIVRRCGL